MAALTAAVDSGQLLMEHIYPAKPEALPLMKQTLSVGLRTEIGAHTRHFCGDSR